MQIRSDDDTMRAALARLDHAETALAVRAERAFLGALEGGCQVPIGALVMTTDGARVLHGFIADVQGRRMVRGSRAIDAENPELGGIRLANELRTAGATEILAGLRSVQRIPSPQPE